MASPDAATSHEGALASLRRLVQEGALEIATPAGRAADETIEVKTVLQIDGDLLTLVRRPELAEATLTEHFRQLRKELDGLVALRTQVMGALALLPAIPLLWGLIATLDAWLGRDLHWWDALRPQLSLLLGGGGLLALVPLATPFAIGLLLRVVGRKG